MTSPILVTKLFIPSTRPELVHRPRLIKQLNAGFRSGRKLILISAPAGFGKTTLLSEWVQTLRDATPSIAVAWLSLDEGDNDTTRFLTYFVAALQLFMPEMGARVLAALQSPQPPSAESILTDLLNEITTIPDNFVLILDDYHVIDAKPVDASKSVDEVLTFLLEHLPPQMHLVIATREDPDLPLPRYRARGQLTELRAADLRFSPSEATIFLNQAMGLNLSKEDIAALEARTEGWIVGLQLAAISMQGHQDTASFIQSFSGSHYFVLDYLIEEVLNQQPKSIQTFLLRTSILDRMCGSLCDALLNSPSASGQETLEFLQQANLFIVPLDNERRWYRYHHLFGDLLRQRLSQSLTPETIAKDHLRASQWYENSGLLFEAFRHATSANEVERTEHLIESKAMPLHLHSVAMAIVDWLVSLPKTVLDARPWLWVKSCTLALMAGQTTGVEERLQAAEAALAAQAALQNIDPALSTIEGLDDKTRDQIGQIACARATLALTRYEPEEMIVQSRRALEYLPPDNLVFRFTANWALASACLLQGNRDAAAEACQEALAISQKSGDIFSTILALSDLGQLQELENQLHLSAETYQRLLPIFGEHPQPNATEVYLGLARISYEWNDLEAAEQYGQQSLQLARQYDRVIDRFIISEVFLARLKLTRGDVEGAAALLDQVEQSARQQNFVLRMPEIAAVKVLILLQQGKTDTAAQVAQQYELPLCQARVFLAQGDPAAALAILEPYRQQMEARGWVDERLKVMVLQSLALQAQGGKDQAVKVLGEVLTLAEPGGFIRLFVDEGAPMVQLLHEMDSRNIAPEYGRTLLAAFSPDIPQQASPSQRKWAGTDSLSEREIEVLQLIARGLTNEEIANRLYISLYTVKAHVRNIFGKLNVTNRTQAVDRARELNILHLN